MTAYEIYTELQRGSNNKYTYEGETFSVKKTGISKVEITDSKGNIAYCSFPFTAFLDYQGVACCLQEERRTLYFDNEGDYSTSERLLAALNHPIWKQHRAGKTYTMDRKPDQWKIAYYPIFEDGKTGEVYDEPRALVEKPINNGTDFREVPLRYLNSI